MIHMVSDFPGRGMTYGSAGHLPTLPMRYPHVRENWLV